MIESATIGLGYYKKHHSSCGEGVSAISALVRDSDYEAYFDYNKICFAVDTVSDMKLYVWLTYNYVYNMIYGIHIGIKWNGMKHSKIFIVLGPTDEKLDLIIQLITDEYQSLTDEQALLEKMKDCEFFSSVAMKANRKMCPIKRCTQ
jgi:hypothetical protein